MKRIDVDPVARTATAETGLTWGELDAATQAHGLATTGGLISTTGIAGLTLGGGVGWLMGRCGLTCDNTLAYEVVTADGAQISATAESHPDLFCLFWALKGGGGNFGVVTSITYRLHAVGTVVSGMLLHPVARAREVLGFDRGFVAAGLPDELIVYAAAITSPDGVAMLAIVPSWSGADPDEGERVLAPLRAFGPPVADLVARMPYTAMQQMMDAAAPFGLRSYWKPHVLGSLPDAAIDAFVRCARACTSPRTFVVLEHGHGAVARVAADATAVRGHAFDLVVRSLWDDPADDARQIAWTRAFHAAMQPWSASMVYVNALSDDDGARVGEAHGANYERLTRIEATYDPSNRFRRNQNIPPAASTEAKRAASYPEPHTTRRSPIS
jgi:FAD/FMN-containing dehydrogenase